MPQAAMLFTSTKPQHIRENAAALEAAASQDQVDAFQAAWQCVIAHWEN